MNYFIFKVKWYDSEDNTQEYINSGIIAADDYKDAVDRVVEDYGNCVLKIFIEKIEKEFYSIGTEELDFFNKRLNMLESSFVF